MIKAFSWDYFKKSGDINAYMTYKKYEDYENDLTEAGNENDIQRHGDRA